MFPTVQTVGSEAGEKVLASALLFPAATERNTPESTSDMAAAFIAALRPPPRDMLATVPLGQFRVAASAVTKSIPAMTPDLIIRPIAVREEDEGQGGKSSADVRSPRAARIENFDGVEVGLFGNSVSSGAGCAGNMGAMAVAVKVLVVGRVEEPCSTTLKFLASC